MDINNICLDDVILPSDIKIELLNTINRLNNLDKYKKIGCYDFDTTILLTGENGTGKTSICRCIAENTNKAFIYKSASSLLDKYVGSSGRLVTELFDEAREKNAVLVLDEFESIARERNQEHNGEALSLMSSLLVELDGMKKNDNFILICITNKKDFLDKAILRRFKVQIEIPLPDLDARINIFELYLSKVKHGKDVDIKELARLTEGRNGDFIRTLVNSAGFHAVDNNRKKVSMDDLMFIFHRMSNAYKIKNKNKVGFN